MTDRSFISILRWLAVIPAALLGQFISSLILPITIGFAASYLDFESNGIVGTLALHGTMAGALALSGSYTAPKFRKITFITLGLLNLAAYIYLKRETMELVGCLFGLITSYFGQSEVWR